MYIPALYFFKIGISVKPVFFLLFVFLLQSILFFSQFISLTENLVIHEICILNAGNRS